MRTALAQPTLQPNRYALRTKPRDRQQSRAAQTWPQKAHSKGKLYGRVVAASSLEQYQVRPRLNPGWEAQASRQAAS